ncbi:hypothetical protein FRC02_001445 [Tulasnella sp. 418]|nr:hypothetical protein FRC02_001445 [Tulasnella sp. 418]
MSVISPAAALLWAILSTLLLCFLLNHLYRFDGYQSLKWGSTTNRQQGSFKRILTYSYILSVPIMIIFSITLASLKYSYGYMSMLDGSIRPVPVEMWDETAKTVLKCIYIMFSIGWALEIVSHLEELNFWLYLLTTTSKPRPWLESPFFIAWCLGSLLAIVGIPTVAGFAGVDPRAEAYIFLAGSVGGLSVTLMSLIVVGWFPKFMNRIRADGAEMDVIVRLAKFRELNNNRVFFRFLFVIPALMLSIDGLSDNPYFQKHPAWTDLLAMMAGVGLVVSSCLTLLIFFPRSFDYESNSPHLSKRSRRGQSMTQRELQYATQKQRYNHQAKNSWTPFPDDSSYGHRRSFSAASSSKSISYPLPVLAKHKHQRSESGHHHVVFEQQDSGVLHRRQGYGAERDYFEPYDDDSSTESGGLGLHKGSTVGYLDDRAIIKSGISHSAHRPSENGPKTVPVVRNGGNNWVAEVSYEAMRASGLRYSDAKKQNNRTDSPSTASQNTMGHRSSAASPTATLRPESSMAHTPQVLSFSAAFNNRTPPVSHEGEVIDASSYGSAGYYLQQRSRI